LFSFLVNAIRVKPDAGAAQQGEKIRPVGAGHLAHIVDEDDACNEQKINK
jgi:hypothetical protein